MVFAVIATHGDGLVLDVEVEVCDRELVGSDEVEGAG